MAHTAMQIGLHKPGNAQDFSKFKIRLNQEEVEDRMNTWAACNIVMQRFVLHNLECMLEYSDTDAGPIDLVLPQDMVSRR